MGAYLHGTFKDIENNTIEVQIQSNSGSGEILIGNDSNSKVFFDEDPVNISLNMEDMFECVLKKTAHISLQSKIYLGDMLFAGNVHDVTVKIYKNNTIIFDGFLQPNSFNQPWANPLDSFELNCVDHLALLQYKHWTDTTSHSTLLNDSAIYSFYQILQKLGLLDYDIHYDTSVTNGTQNIWQTAGISINVFLGEDESKTMNYEEILTHVLRYLNLHIIQEGSSMYIFNWAKVISNSLPNAFGGGNHDIVKEDYSDDSTSLSMDDVYNQIQVKCVVDSVGSVIKSVLDSGDINNLYSDAGKGQLCLTEAWYDGGGNGTEAGTFFRDSAMFVDENSAEVIVEDNNCWHAKDWFVRWQTNPLWSIYYNDTRVESYVPKENGDPVYQPNVLKLMYENPFMANILSIGSAPEINTNNQSRRGSPQLNQYLAISCCPSWGVYKPNNVTSPHYMSRTFETQEALDAAIDSARLTAAGTNGMLHFDSGVALNASPIDNGTHFLVIQGKILLDPAHAKTGTGPVGDIVRSGAGASWGRVKNWLQNNDLKHFGRHNWYSFVNGGRGSEAHYQQIPWNSKNYPGASTADESTTLNYMSPPVGGNIAIPPNYFTSKFTYKGTQGDGNDTITKVPILECELKIGDKYAVELSEVDEYGDPKFAWYTAEEAENAGYPNKSFTIGFNPNVGDYIFGKEWDMTNTADGRRCQYEGLAIPIKKDDKLVGQVSFKIKKVMPVEWEGYVHVDRAFGQSSYTHIEGYYNLWANTSAIWIKNFDIKFDNDNVSSESIEKKDLLYMSDETHSYLKKKDDIEFYLNTQLTSNEATTYGMDSSVALSNVINLSTNDGILTIKAPNGTNKAEKLYIDQYWNLYNIPKVVIDTQIHNNDYNIFNTFTFNGFGKMIPIGITNNLMRNVINLKCRQV
jgi:hypothetical protein